MYLEYIHCNTNKVFHQKGQNCLQVNHVSKAVVSHYGEVNIREKYSRTK